MSKLGDFFSDDLRKNFSQRNVKVGSVLKLKVEDTKPPKVKFFIIIGQNIEGFSLATLYINSDINFNVNFSQDLIDLQVPISKEDYNFLEHNSYVDCSKLMFKDREEIESILSRRPEAFVDELNNKQISYLKEVIKKSTTIKGKIKKRYGFYE